MSRILIVDDDDGLRESLGETVADLGHSPLLAASGREALTKLADVRVDAVLLDLRMPDMDGIEVLRVIRSRDKDLPVVVLTAFATAANTIEAMRLAAFDHLMKPVGRQELADVIARMLSVATEIAPLPAAMNDTLVGNSAGIRKVQKAIGMLADRDMTVLILGETGTGKELVARALHTHGRRKGEAFVPVNCAAIPADLLESELFGHSRGAFTGAVADRAGAFREANRGTLFLDEIGDMPLPMQAKMLRALEERVVTPVGGRPISVDVRVIAATHRDLPQLVAAKQFREDLYYRLNVASIALPPLNERQDDIPLLAYHFLADGSGDVQRFSAAAIAKLQGSEWPGNIRQLRNVVQQASAMARGPVIDAADIEANHPIRSSTHVEAGSEDLARAVEDLERRMIAKALADNRGNRTEAARALGINRQLLYTKMERYGLGPVSGKLTRNVGNHDVG